MEKSMSQRLMMKSMDNNYPTMTLTTEQNEIS